MKKRLLCLLLIFTLCLLPVLAQSASLDLTKLSNDELLALWEATGQRLVEVGAYPYIEITSKTFGEAVLRLQKRLTQLYYYTQEPSGQYDKATSKAFAAFMKQNGQKAGKTVTVENQRYLFSTDAIPNTTPTPPPTPTPAPAPFFLQGTPDLNAPFGRFVEKLSNESLFMQLIKNSVTQNEFYTVENWLYNYEAEYYPFMEFIPHVYAWTENSSGRMIAVAFRIDTLFYDHSIQDEFAEIVDQFASELGCSSSIRFGVKKVTNNYFKLTALKEIYGDQFPESKFNDSSEIQSFMGLRIIFSGVASKARPKYRGAIIIIGLDDRIASLPFFDYTSLPAPTPTPSNPATVSAFEFRSIYVGMSYDDVVYTFGGYGQAGSTSKTSSGTFSDYTWKSETGGIISITFLDGEVYRASEYK